MKYNKLYFYNLNNNCCCANTNLRKNLKNTF